MLTLKQMYMIDFGYRADRPIAPVFHSHPFYELYYFHEGRCNYLIGDKIYVLEPGDLILMYGMTLHCPKVYPGAAYIRSIIHFEPEALRPFLALPHAVNVLQPFEELKNYRLRLQGDARAEVERILAHMDALQKQATHLSLNRMRLAFMDLLCLVHELCSAPLGSRAELSVGKERTAQEIIACIEQHYREDLTLDDLQERLHMSKSYLSKIFREVSGFTIFDFLYRWRINQARILFLLQPELTVTEVALEVGFKHLPHFSRVFKQQLGMSAEQYRKQLRQH